MGKLNNLEGYWWIPGDEERQLPGRLVADGDNYKLILNIDRPSESLFDESSAREYQLIHGLASTGEQLSLLDCFDFSSRQSSSGVERREIFVNLALDGGLIPVDKLDSAFTEMVLKWPSLKRWFQSTGIEVEHSKEDYAAFSISYRPQERIHVRYSSEIDVEFSFTTDRMPVGGLLSDKIKFSEVVWVSVKADKPQGLDYFLKLQTELEHFFSVCVLEYLPPKVTSFVAAFDHQALGDDHTYTPHLTLHGASYQTQRSKRLPHPMDIVVGFNQVKDCLEDVLARWHEVAERIHPARSLYFSSLYGRKQYVETEFLFLAQAVEVLHRRLRKGTYMESSEFKDRVRSKLEEALPDDLDAELMDVFRQKLQYLNEYSLRQRLVELSNDHLNVVEHYVPDWEAQIKGIVAARNHYTHYTAQKKYSSPDINKLVLYIELLQMLMELEILGACGLDLNMVHKRALDCQHYRWAFPAAR